MQTLNRANALNPNLPADARELERQLRAAKNSLYRALVVDERPAARNARFVIAALRNQLHALQVSHV